MSGSFNSGDLMGADLGRWVLAMCVVVAGLVLAPIGLASVGTGAVLGVAGGLGTPSAKGNTGQVPIEGTMPTTSLQPLPTGGGPIQSVVTTAYGLVSGWAERGPLNQYLRSNYRSDQSWATWRNADCSAAALDWLLGAYGQQFGSLDDAIALIGPRTGISPNLGLLDARGPALARALASHGLSPREPRTGEGQLKPLASVAELEAWLNEGPLLMDGARWFGEGHWFVGIGYDAGGIFIRDSSGWDNRYLSWSRLYGEVGFSGWVVGVGA
ncbi:MAG: hypothetical protein ACR2IK_22345 [Chloroflexota bacterium]